jgi:hypothetical protein
VKMWSKGSLKVAEGMRRRRSQIWGDTMAAHTHTTLLFGYDKISQQNSTCSLHACYNVVPMPVQPTCSATHTQPLSVCCTTCYHGHWPGHATASVPGPLHKVCSHRSHASCHCTLKAHPQSTCTAQTHSRLLQTAACRACAA